MPQFEEFEYNGDNDPTMPDGMTGWFEIYDAAEEHAWIASDTTMEARR